MDKPDFSAIRAQYQAAWRVEGDSPRALFWLRGRQPLRFQALTAHFLPGPLSVLDYGCGLAHLKPFLEARHPALRYEGADLVPEFIEACRRKHPEARFQLSDGDGEVEGVFDHVVLSGVFSLRYGADPAAHAARVKEILRRLFARCRVSLSVDFMTDRVDFQQPGAWHQNLDELLAFITAELSPRFTVDSSYLPYEYAVIIHKDTQIEDAHRAYAAAPWPASGGKP